MNEYDSNRICDLVKKINYVATKDIEEADCYLLNTCHIREKATEKVYHDIGRVKKSFRNKKKPIVVIIGCVAQAEGEILLNNEKYIDAVLGPQSYHNFNNTLVKLDRNLQNLSHPSWIVIIDEMLLSEFFIIFKLSNLSTTSNSVKFIFFDSFSTLEIISFIW